MKRNLVEESKLPSWLEMNHEYEKDACFELYLIIQEFLDAWLNYMYSTIS